MKLSQLVFDITRLSMLDLASVFFWGKLEFLNKARNVNKDVGSLDIVIQFIFYNP